MRKRKLGAVVVKSFALLVMSGMAYQAMPQDATTPHPNMAPIKQYLMVDQGAEIALARSAAPESISRDAEVLVLGRHGFETAVKGKNGFLCIAARSWTSATDPDFWNPKVRVPMCVNAQPRVPTFYASSAGPTWSWRTHESSDERDHRQKITAGEWNPGRCAT